MGVASLLAVNKPSLVSRRSFALRLSLSGRGRRSNCRKNWPDVAVERTVLGKEASLPLGGETRQEKSHD